MIIDNIGWRTFIVFAVLNAAFLPMVYIFYRETKGLEFEDIPLLFARGGSTGGVFSSKGAGRWLLVSMEVIQQQWNAAPRDG